MSHRIAIVKLRVYYFRKDTKLMTKSIIVELKVVKINFSIN